MKVGTIVNIMQVFYTYKTKLDNDVRKLEYYRVINDTEHIKLAVKKVDEDRKKLGEFLDLEV